MLCFQPQTCRVAEMQVETYNSLLSASELLGSQAARNMC